MTDVTLSPEQERFAAEAVASGRYRDVSEVVDAALDGLRQLERQRAELLASVIAAEQEGERDGFLGSRHRTDLKARLAARTMNAPMPPRRGRRRAGVGTAAAA